MEEVLQKPVKVQHPKKPVLKSLKPRRKILVALRKPLTTKKAVELLLKGTLKRKVCRYCLKIAYPLSDLDQCLSIGGQGAVYNIAIRDMVASVHPFKVEDDCNLPNKICPKCINQALRAYLFAQQCEQAQRAVRNCFDDIYDKLQKLDPLNPTKKRGRQKTRPNHNVLYTEHAKVIDYAEPIRHLINSGSVSLTDEPEMSELECKKCWQVFPNVESLVIHEKTHPKTMWYHCRLCGRSFAKLYHFRKHSKAGHNSESWPVPANKSFTCKQCAFTSEDYNVHLQHIEKHKFKHVMEHLVERKMDELCSVCLDKGPLQDLEKTIRLHGAYPELTGNRSLYNILGSTIPEKVTHKYMELLVPSYANVLTITKKAKNNTFITSEEAEDLNLNTFALSDPFVISTESANDRSMYFFIFSEPKILLPNNVVTIEENTVEKVNEPLKKIENYDADDVKRSKLNADNVETENLNFWENNVGYIEESVEEYTLENNATMVDKKQDEHETGEGRQRCKLCWVFEKSGQCDACKNKYQAIIDPKPAECFESKEENHIMDTNMVAVIKNSKTTYNADSSHQCMLCWVFKSVGKCNYCETSTQNTFNQTETVAVKGTEDCNTKQSKSQKRKCNETVRETDIKRSRWECSVCLTVNDSDRDTCICCDSEALKNDSLRIKFGLNTSYLKGILGTPEKLQPISTAGDNSLENSKINCDFTDNFVKNAEINDNNMKLKTNVNFEIGTALLFEGVAMTSHENDMQCSVHDDKTTTNEKVGDGNIHQEDAMDIEDADDVTKPTSPFNLNPNPSKMFSPNQPNPVQNNTFNFFTPITTVQNSFSMQPETVQFNIGTSFQDMKPARKFKRPLRRIATKFNK